MNIENEIWKPIDGFEYEVSNLGRVKSLPRNTTSGKILKPIKNWRGYLRVGLSKDGKLFLKSVHRLVAEAFIENPNNLPEVNHLSEDKTDNRVQNLCWISNIDNINYGTGIERRAKTHCKKVNQYDLDGNFIQEWDSAADIQKNLGIPKQNISKCCLGLRHTCGGFVWKFENE